MLVPLPPKPPKTIRITALTKSFLAGKRNLKIVNLPVRSKLIFVMGTLFSCSIVSDSATPWTVACQAPLSMEKQARY